MYCSSHVVWSHICPWPVPCVSLFSIVFSGLKSTGYMNGWRQKLPVLTAPGSHYERLPTLYSERSLHVSAKRELQLFVICRPSDCLCCSCTLHAGSEVWQRHFHIHIHGVCSGMGALWGLVLLMPILRPFSGTWMVCFCFASLTLSGLIESIFPMLKQQEHLFQR